ncbi:gamma-glutamyl-gamma-aminobutyrate hydrolase family protein [Heyndrickxia sporothermodurans]|uniref:Gamma-glutamyl-gamma-aminobutyrate hydrolase family protein n=1 Tax=Heyndrickxia sporothermodurans TaxID=46224 RepID=A0AB37HIF1_9BACI|nr:gamma-glutamyl-gamma-aminobutyrate hydrolase family protein [Heyndrickxia sporothermodurans]MBL5766963.1 gamma-glutamyl-gamma-aminobutyrate hydrolase family protein [Heyndrickxia sporothermodurans]MBL5770431.1 gamma-glutamyl-gamma-aminobutyrate hydrolase family protein [Heyndrickxia sporothermodurans]MBL5774877.1 gamma-glutamyl-gamma-aminobutyrate hydrolase family protein [Heyndrickxia sporothermodurans]MBL5777573.1 gamma-glutamyl-gamma-aminobutyrate hydrolase family protein [Heyndrickxia sp
MKPLIGITANVDFDWKHTLGNDYLQAVIQAGGIPIILPAGVIGDAAHLAKKLDGLVLSGGGDIDPTLFGDEPHQKLGSISPGRDHYEIELIQHMLKLDKPILAICRGIQILNIAVEGDMYQDIYSQIDSPVIQHTQNAVRYHLSHYVQVEKNSLLAEIAGQVQFKVNSFHHQAVRKVVQPFEVVARSSDGVIEAIESKLHKFVVGVQWHPEPLAVHGDPISQRIFQRFIQFSI